MPFLFLLEASLISWCF